MIAVRTSQSPLELLMEQERQERMEAGVAQALAQLSERERFILTSRFCLDGGGEPLTQAECAEVLNISTGYVGQLEAKAMRRLECRVREVAVEALGLQCCPRCGREVLALRLRDITRGYMCSVCLYAS